VETKYSIPAYALHFNTCFTDTWITYPSAIPQGIMNKDDLMELVQDICKEIEEFAGGKSSVGGSSGGAEVSSSGAVGNATRGTINLMKNQGDLPRPIIRAAL
jgi:hypothetical protein